MAKAISKSCPKCSSKENIVPIRYGMPGVEMQQEHHDGKIKLGGCGIVDNAPEWYCNKCEHDF